MSQLTDKKPALKWEEAYPLGNGRLGAMIFGGPDEEQIQLNEDSIWYGKPIDRINPDCIEHLPQIRELIRKGKIPEAERQIKLYISGTPQSERPYQSAGNLSINWQTKGNEKEETGYQRYLDLSKAIAGNSYGTENGKVTKEYLISSVDQVLAFHAEASGEERLSCTLLLTRSRIYDEMERIGDDTILMHASCGADGVSFVVAVKAFCKEGKVEIAGEHLLITDAREITLYTAIESTFYQGEEGRLPDASYGSGKERIIDGIICALSQEKEQNNPKKRALKRIQSAVTKGYDKIKEDHIQDHQTYFSRVKLELSGEKDIQARLDHTTTYFDYGRYLLICSSRPGTLPANLQGIWNKEMLPCWDSKYTININTEMNYWLAESCNLPEFHRPLFDLIKRMYARGRETAQRMYGCRGFVAHHNTDIWADCAPQDIWISSAYWVMGAAWLCTHVRMHYEHTEDLEFLKEMYPIVKDAAIFFHDFLIEDKGELVTSPSVSPENTYILPDGTTGCICMGAAMDNQILRDLLEFALDAAKILEDEDEIYTRNLEILQKIPKNKIGKHGQLMEWREDYDEIEPGHRHISHLYALHPSNQITVDETPELAKAAEITLERRLRYGGGHTGWSQAWIINLFARLGKGEDAWEGIKRLFDRSTFPNLMDNHPMLDYFVFQIDGNFGATAGIVEMVVQSNKDRVLLLPAIPADWRDGHLNGVVLHGGAVADITWKDGILTGCKILCRPGWKRKIYYKDQIWNAAEIIED